MCSLPMMTMARQRWGRGQGPWAEMRWEVGDRLLVRYAERARLFKKASEVDGVEVRYEAVKP